MFFRGKAVSGLLWKAPEGLLEFLQLTGQANQLIKQGQEPMVGYRGSTHQNHPGLNLEQVRAFRQPDRETVRQPEIDEDVVVVLAEQLDDRLGVDFTPIEDREREVHQRKAMPKCVRDE